MADPIWTRTLADVVASFPDPDDTDPAIFLDWLVVRTKMFPQAAQLFSKRMKKEQRKQLVTALRRLTKEPVKHKARRQRQQDYKLLAGIYDCVFEWREDREAGKPPSSGSPHGGG